MRRLQGCYGKVADWFKKRLIFLLVMAAVIVVIEVSQS